MRILKVKYRTREEFLESYSEDPPAGTLFCPTTRPHQEGQQVVAEVRFPDLPNKTLVRGTVRWWRTALPRLRVRAGALVAFVEEDRDTVAFLVDVARGNPVQAIKRRHQRIPLTVDVQFRRSDEVEPHEGVLQDVSVGGAHLVSEAELQSDEEIVLELTAPGAAYPMSIAAKVTHARDTGVGLRFLYRDGGGSQRLREMVRRLVSDA